MALPQNINLLTFSKGKKGYLKANAEQGYTTISVNKATGGIEVKIHNTKNMETEIKKWLGCERKDNSKKPSVDKAYYSRVLWLIQNPKEMESHKIKLAGKSQDAIARLELAIAKAQA